MKMENLKRLEMFFDYDMKVKQLMYKIAFKEDLFYSEEVLMDYEENLFKALEEIEYYLYRIANTYHSTLLSTLSAMIEKIKQELTNASLNPVKIKEIYQNRISNMRPEFVHSVSENCCGYYLFSGSDVLPPTSINEMLHLLHALIVNNEDIYQSMPEVNLENAESPVHLYGYSTKIACEITKSIIAAKLPSYRIDILSLQDRTLLMARDLGHALMVEIQYIDNKVVINYFIPKICNYIMVNELPGITKVAKESPYAKGQFETTPDLPPQQLSYFLSKVPTDDDMFIEGGLCYERQRTK